MEEKDKTKPDNFLVWAILSTVLCCLPIGIVAVVYANQVDSLWYAGKYNESEDAAKKAKLWTLIGAGAGAAGVFLFIFFMLLMAILG